MPQNSSRQNRNLRLTIVPRDSFTFFLPVDAKIEQISVDEAGDVVIFASHPHFPEIQPGGEIPAKLVQFDQ